MKTGQRSSTFLKRAKIRRILITSWRIGRWVEGSSYLIMAVCQSWHWGISRIPCHPLLRKGGWRLWNRGFLARMPMNHYIKAGTRATVQSSSSISIKMSQFRPKRAYCRRSEDLGARRSGTPFGSAFRNRADRRIPTEGFNLQLLMNNKRLETGKEESSSVTLVKGP